MVLGLVKSSLAGTIGGGVVFGVSVIFSAIFAVVFLTCFKHNNVNSNTNDQRNLPHQRPHRHQGNNRPNARANREQTSSYEIRTVSGTDQQNNPYQYQQQTSVGYDLKKSSSTTQNTGLGDSTYSVMRNQPSPKKYSGALNQSNGSMNYQNQQAVIHNSMGRNNQR